MDAIICHPIDEAMVYAMSWDLSNRPLTIIVDRDWEADTIGVTSGILLGPTKACFPGWDVVIVTRGSADTLV